MRYLNHAGTSWPKPAPVRGAETWAQALEPGHWATAFDDAHHRVASAFGVEAAALRLTPGCTSALAVGVADVPWQPGDRVLTSGLEHHALWRPLMKLAGRGVTTTVMGRSVDGPLDLDDLERELAVGGVRLVAMSAASNLTGEALPIAAIVERAHAHGALCLIDGAQVAGWMPLDLAALEVDLFAFAGHKGPQAPMGIGGLYVRPGVFLDTPPAACEGALCVPGPGYCDTGSVNLPALVGLAAGLKWMAERAPLPQALALAGALRDHLEPRPRVRVLGARSDVPTVAFVVEGLRSDAVGDAMGRGGVRGRSGTHCAPRAHDTMGSGEAGAMRLSFGPASTEADVQAACAVLDQLLAT